MVEQAERDAQVPVTTYAPDDEAKDAPLNAVQHEEPEESTPDDPVWKSKAPPPDDDPDATPDAPDVELPDSVPDVSEAAAP